MMWINVDVDYQSPLLNGWWRRVMNASLVTMSYFEGGGGERRGAREGRVEVGWGAAQADASGHSSHRPRQISDHRARQQKRRP